MKIPTVTPEDLLAFHKKHFAPEPQPTQPEAPQIEQHNHYEEATYSAEEYYDPETEHLDLGPPLGFYPDGTPRYLTDEQIAIMRHSELWAAYKKMYLQPEQAPSPSISPQSAPSDSHEDSTTQQQQPESEARNLKRPSPESRPVGGENIGALPYDDEDVEAFEAYNAANPIVGDGEVENGRKRARLMKAGDGKGKNKLVEKKGGFVWPVLGVIPKEV